MEPIFIFKHFLFQSLLYSDFHYTHKRVFLMAPIHHHFEKKGWAETKVVIRFWIIAAAFGAVGLALFFQLG